MSINERRECPQILLLHLLEVFRVSQYLLNQQGIHVDQTDLEEVERKRSEFLLIQAIGGKIATPTVKDKTIGTIPVLYAYVLFLQVSRSWVTYVKRVELHSTIKVLRFPLLKGANSECLPRKESSPLGVVFVTSLVGVQV